MSSFGPTTTALGITSNPLQGLSQAAGVTSLFFRRRKNVLLGPGVVSEFTEDQRSEARTSRELNVIRFDAVTSEEHSMSADITEHPVEKGADITDHIRKRPDSLRITGIVSNTPVIFGAAIRRITEDPVRDALEILQDIMKKGIVVDVVTTLRSYEGMAITDVVVSRDATTGNILDAGITLRKIRIVTRGQGETAAKNPKNASRSPGADGGDKSPQAAPAPEAAKVPKSALKILTGGV